jgi:hypothetical protein
MHTFFDALPYSMLLLVVVLPAPVLPAQILPISASPSVQVQSIPEIRPDRQGNYYSNESSVQAKITNSTLAAGSLWRVAVNALNCRRSPSINSDVIRTYLIGELLEVEVYRGGSDEVFVNRLDRKGKPWMPVRGRDIQDICYVRANSRYIQPFTAR